MSGQPHHNTEAKKGLIVAKSVRTRPPGQRTAERPVWLFDAEQNKGIRSKQNSADRIGQCNNQEAGHHHRQSVSNLSYASQHCRPLLIQALMAVVAEWRRFGPL